jgi:hypothetical protein
VAVRPLLVSVDRGYRQITLRVSGDVDATETEALRRLLGAGLCRPANRPVVLDLSLLCVSEPDCWETVREILAELPSGMPVKVIASADSRKEIGNITGLTIVWARPEAKTCRS